MSQQQPSRNRRGIVSLTSTALVVVSVTIVACGGGNQPGYANEGDTGAAAPATQQTLSPNPAMGDSTQGLQGRTGRPQAAGDSGGPSVARPDTSRGQNLPPVPAPGQKRP